MTEVLPRPSSTTMVHSQTLIPNAIPRVVRSVNSNLVHSQSLDFSKAREFSYDSQDGTIMWDAQAQGVNRKLMRLAVDSRTSTKRASFLYDDSVPLHNKNKSTRMHSKKSTAVSYMKVRHLNDSDDARFPRIEEMSHFHYNNIELKEQISVSLHFDENEDIEDLDTGQGLLVQVNSGNKSWIVKRSQEDFVGLDRQIHRCLFDRRYSQLPTLKDYELGTKLTTSMVQQMQLYLSRFSDVAGNNLNCGPILNWLELDNHGNHLVVMEADDSAINVPAVAAARVLKRYQAQAPDEMSLEVGDFLSVIDMPPVEETIWWRGKKSFEVGFFPSHCVEILGEKEINDRIIAHLQSRPISKRRGKFISFLRFFFKSRPSKDELVQSGIFRERVFGCDLGERLAKTGRDIPLVLEMCAAVIEEHGIVDGIYRLSGILSNLQSLRVAFDNDSEPPNLKDTKYLHDIHCISSLLKTYFRELPNPLFTYELYDKFVMAISKEDDTEKTVAFHHVIQRLPPPHYRTMSHLLRHLSLCANNANETNMTAKNLAIVWAPNLLRPNSEDSVAALAEFRTQAIIVEYMIRNADVFFDKNLASAAIAYYPEVQESTQNQDSTLLIRAATNCAGPKLITLEEARQRVLAHRKVSETVSIDSSTSNSPRQSKLRSSQPPPKVAANPVMPLPTLLSIEEAQARTKTEKDSKMLMKRRGSVDFPEMKNGINSPRRSKKWFGLFTKARSEDDPNIPTYRKKKEDRWSQRSQSENRLIELNKTPSNQESTTRANSFVASVRERDSILSPETDDELKMKFSDGDDSSLMSAVVSVTAKYINVDKSRNATFSIGEPQEFRRLNDTELLATPPRNVMIKNDPAILEKQNTGISSAQLVRRYKGTQINNERNFESSSDSANAKQIIFSPERKHHRQVSDENVPLKRLRSLSPESYHSVETTQPHTKDIPITIDNSKDQPNKLLYVNDSQPRSRGSSPERTFQLVAAKPVNNSKPKHSHDKGHEIKMISPTREEKVTVDRNLDHTTNSSPSKAKHTYSRSYSESTETFQMRQNEIKRGTPHSKSLYNSRTPNKDLPSPVLQQSPFTFRRMRSKSEEDRLLDSLVQQTENKIKTGKVEALVIPRRDYNDDLEMPEHTESTEEPHISPASSALVKSTETRFDPNFTLQNNGGYVLKQRRLGTTNLTLTSYEERAQTSADISEKVQSERAHGPERVFSKVEYVNVNTQLRKERASTSSHENTRNNSSTQNDNSPLKQGNRGGETKARSRSVKERIAVFDHTQHDTDVHSSHPDLGKAVELALNKRYETTRSFPNLNENNIEVCSSNSIKNYPKVSKDYPNERDLSRSYVNILRNRHSSYIPGHITSQELRRTDSDAVGQIKGCSSTDKLVASCVSRGNSDIKPAFIRKRETKTKETRRPVSEFFLDRRTANNIDPVHVNSLSRPNSEYRLSTDRQSSDSSQVSFTSSYSPSLYPSGQFKRSVSDNRLTDDDGGRKIGSFPLTLKNGSARNSRTNVVNSKQRPLSMYDNHRGSYYDNVHNIHYEML